MNEYRNLPSADRRQARNLAISGAPSGKPDIDRSAYVWYRGQIVAVLAVAITFIIFSVVDAMQSRMTAAVGALAGSAVPLAVGFYQWRHIRRVAAVARKRR